jgi:hypothetical protein
MRYTWGMPNRLPALLPLALLAAWAVLSPVSAAGPSHKGPSWTARDSLEALALIKAWKSRPASVDSLVSRPGNLVQEQDLGFGYRLKEVWVNPAGKLGFSFKLLRRGSATVSFEAKPVLNYVGLAPRYQGVLQAAFTRGPDSPGGMPAYLPYHWNLEAAAALPADSLGLAAADPAPGVREALAFYMSPYSGTTYGIRGGRGGQLLENRDRFLGLQDDLMPDKTRALYLLRSLNPASRLTAAEFIVRHKAAFPEYDRLLAGPLKRVFANPARVETLRGEALVREDARKLVLEYAQIEVKRTGRGVLRQ